MSLRQIAATCAALVLVFATVKATRAFAMDPLTCSVTGGVWVADGPGSPTGHCYTTLKAKVNGVQYGTEIACTRNGGKVTLAPKGAAGLPANASVCAVPGRTAAASAAPAPKKVACRASTLEPTCDGEPGPIQFDRWVRVCTAWPGGPCRWEKE